MKTFQQFQEDAYKDPKNINKVAKEYEKGDFRKFPNAEARDDIKKYTDEITDHQDPTDISLKKLFSNMLKGFTRRSTPVVGRDTKYVNPNTSGNIINSLKQNFKKDNKFDINKNQNLRVIKHPMLAPEYNPNLRKIPDFT